MISKEIHGDYNLKITPNFKRREIRKFMQTQQTLRGSPQESPAARRCSLLCRIRSFAIQMFFCRLFFFFFFNTYTISLDSVVSLRHPFSNKHKTRERLTDRSKKKKSFKSFLMMFAISEIAWQGLRRVI